MDSRFVFRYPFYHLKVSLNYAYLHWQIEMLKIGEREIIDLDGNHAVLFVRDNFFDFLFKFDIGKFWNKEILEGSNQLIVEFK